MGPVAGCGRQQAVDRPRHGMPSDTCATACQSDSVTARRLPVEVCGRATTTSTTVLHYSTQPTICSFCCNLILKEVYTGMLAVRAVLYYHTGEGARCAAALI